MNNRALKGLKVVEYGHWISGPFCARLLADMGADVVKVEVGDGDPSRQNGPFPRDQRDPEKSGLFLYVNCNKKGLCLDLNTPDGMNRLRGLISEADVFVENQHPETMERQTAMIHQMDTEKVNWVILGDVPLDGRDDLRFRHTHGLLWRHIMENFEPVPAEGLPWNYQLLKRK